MQWASSVASVFRNLRRAGVEKNSSFTSTVVPVLRAAGRSSPLRASSKKALDWAMGRESSDISDTEAIAASASPRKPMVATVSRSFRLVILLVAWRRRATGSSSCGMPPPSSSTVIRRTPPADRRTVICVAPASSALSTSSRTTEAGRSTTSPAAIWLISSSGRSRMGRRVVRCVKEAGSAAARVGVVSFTRPILGRGPRRGIGRCLLADGDNARNFFASGAPTGYPMELVTFLIDFILHVDKYLEAFVQTYGAWVYALLFLIVFVETGVVVMPFLPGDSLLFIVGALCGAGMMSFPLACAVLIAAAILGDQCNYSIGRFFGPKVFQWEDSRWFNRRAFNQAHDFYERYGGITIILARFMPFIRTFAPFVAGVAEMSRAKFTAFNVAGALIWVLGICSAGYFFGNFAWVKENLDKIIWAMIFVPGLIAIFGAWRAGRQAKAA